MNCSNCKNLFNTTNHIPRLLPNCGHSFCETCLLSMIIITKEQPLHGLSPLSGGTLMPSAVKIIKCLICNTMTALNQSLDSINQLPKNVSLIDSIVNLNDFITANSLSLIMTHQNNKQKCQLHNKDLEVYCENDSILLCVNCLLEKSHLSHKLIPIDEAIQSEKEKIANEYHNVMSKEKSIIESIEKIELLIANQKQKCNECIKDFNELYDDIIATITAKKNKSLEEINKRNESQNMKSLKKKDKLMEYIRKIKSIKGGNNLMKDNEIYSFIHLKNLRALIEEILNLDQRNLNIKTQCKTNTINKEKEIDYIIDELEEYKKRIISDKNDNQDEKEEEENEEEQDSVKNQSNGKIINSNTNQDILITNTSSVQTNSNYNINDDVIGIKEITILPLNTTMDSQHGSNQKRNDTKQINNGTANPLQQQIQLIDTKQSSIEYIDINNQSTFKYTKGSSINKSPNTKCTKTNTLFPPFKSSSSNQLNLNQLRPLKSITSFLNSNYSENDSINLSSSLIIPLDNEVKIEDYQDINNLNNTNAEAELNNVKAARMQTRSLFNSSVSKDFSSLDNNPISPFLRNYLIENNNSNNTEMSYGLNYTSSIISNSNHQEISMLYKKISTSYILIGGKSDCITRQWCIDSMQWSTLSKPSSTSNSKQSRFIDKDKDKEKDILVDRSDFGLLKYKEKKTLLLGGKVNINGMESITDSVHLFDIDKRSIDKLDFKLKTPKCAFGTLYIQSQIFIAGGSDGRCVLNNFEFFDKKTKQWYDLPKMNTKRKHLSLIASFDNCIFAIGGQDDKGNILKTTEKYDMNKRTWVKVKEMNQNRRSHSVVCMPDGIYVLGGYDGAQYLKSVEKYDFMTRKWEYLTDMNYTKSDFCVMASNDCRFIYTFGGYNGKPLNVIEQYDIFDNQWKHFSSMPCSRYKHHVIENISEINNKEKN